MFLHVGVLSFYLYRERNVFACIYVMQKGIFYLFDIGKRN